MCLDEQMVSKVRSSLLRALQYSFALPAWGIMSKQIAPQVPATTSGSSSEAAVAGQEVRPSNSVISFYSHKQGHPYREFSNFFRHIQPFEFVLPAFAQRDGFPKSILCSFSEKAIMATKAALMADLETFRAIDEADNPKLCKALGREVRAFDDELWQYHLEQTAFEVVKQKFESDKSCRDLLLSTGDAILAEAAPNDSIWGIGLHPTDPRVQNPAQWCGRNILGVALMRTRAHLRGRDVASATPPMELAVFDFSAAVESPGRPAPGGHPAANTEAPAGSESSWVVVSGAP